MSTDCITDCVRLVKSDPRAGRPCSSADCISAPPQQLACQWRDVTTADRPTPYASTLESEPIARVAGAGLPSRPALLPKVRSRASRLAPLAAPARRRTDCPERLLPEHGGRSHWPPGAVPEARADFAAHEANPAPRTFTGRWPCAYRVTSQELRAHKLRRQRSKSVLRAGQVDTRAIPAGLSGGIQKGGWMGAKQDEPAVAGWVSASRSALAFPGPCGYS